MSTTGAILTIGGTCPRRLVVDLCTRISNRQVGLQWGEYGFTPGGAHKTADACTRDLLEALDEKRHLTLYDENAREGMMSNLEEWLQTHRIPFTRFSDPTDDCEPRRTDFRPGRPLFDIATDAGRQTLIALAPIQKVITFLASPTKPLAQRVQLALRMLRQLTGEDLPVLPPFTIGPAPRQPSTR